MNGAEAQVEDGLEEGEKVVLHPGEAVGPGALLALK
jgi:hypothetical protein